MMSSFVLFMTVSFEHGRYNFHVGEVSCIGNILKNLTPSYVYFTKEMQNAKRLRKQSQLVLK